MGGERSGRGARFVYVSDGAATRPGDGDDRPGRYGWWLVAANNRPIGRGVRIAASLAECRSAAATVRSRRGVLDAQLSGTGPRRQWRWLALLDGASVAASMHGYARRAECARALDGFLAALPGAQPEDGALWRLGSAALRDFEPATPATAPPATAAGRHA